MSTAPPSPLRAESAALANRGPARRWWLVALTLMAGLLLGAALTVCLDREPALGSRSVADLIKAAQRHDTWWDGVRSRVWPGLPGLIRDRFPGLMPVQAVYVREQACAELANLGGAAAEATHVLTRAIDDPRPEVQLEAIRALGAIGLPAESAKSGLLAKLSESAGQTNAPPFGADEFFDDVPALVRKLKQPTNAWTIYVSGQLSMATRQALMEYRESISDSEALAGKLALDINRLAGGPSIYEPERFAGVRWRSSTQRLLAQNPRGVKVSRLNRSILRDAMGLTPRGRFEVLRYSERLFEEVPLIAVRAGTGVMGAAPQSWPIREAVVVALAAIAPEDPTVVSALLDEYEAHSNDGAGRAIYELIRQSGHPLEMFEAAMEIAPSPDKGDFVQALALASMPTAQRTSVLTALVNHPDADVKFAAVGMLGRMGDQAVAAVPVLTNLLGWANNDRRAGRTSGLRQQLIVNLGLIGPGARAAIPQLEAEYRDVASPWRMDAALARWRIDGNCAETLPILAEGLKDKDMLKRRRTLEWLTEVTGRSREGLAYLIKGLEDPEDIIRVQAIAALVSFGNKATAAVPALEELSAHAKHFVSLPAQRAVETIQATPP